MHIFDKRFIAVVEAPSSWEEAVSMSGELLMKEGKIEQSYIDAMIHNIKTLGPYIIIAPLVAMPHARPEDGVKERAISVVVLEKPVSFGEDKDAKLIICLAATDSESHLKLIQTITSWLQDEELLEKIMNAPSTDELHTLLKEFYF